LIAIQQIASALVPVDLDTEASKPHWFAVQTRPRFEKKVSLELQEKGIQCFLPLHSVKHQWSDRKQSVLLPLFPGYTFVHVEPGQIVRVAILRTNGVLNFVGAKGIGTPIPDDEIEAVQALLKQHIPWDVCPYAKVGQTVRILGGALDGVKGTLTKINGDRSLVISVELIQRSVAMRLTGYDIEPV
jgi:transcription antitermination factor NusG